MNLPEENGDNFEEVAFCENISSLDDQSIYYLLYETNCTLNFNYNYEIDDYSDSSVSEKIVIVFIGLVFLSGIIGNSVVVR